MHANSIVIVLLVSLQRRQWPTCLRTVKSLASWTEFVPLSQQLVISPGRCNRIGRNGRDVGDLRRDCRGFLLHRGVRSKATSSGRDPAGPGPCAPSRQSRETQVGRAVFDPRVTAANRLSAIVLTYHDDAPLCARRNRRKITALH